MSGNITLSDFSFVNYKFSPTIISPEGKNAMTSGSFNCGDKFTITMTNQNNQKLSHNETLQYTR